MPHAFPRQSHFSRAAFAFGGWVMLLFLVLIGVCIVNSYLTWSRLPPPGRGAYQAGFRLGIWFVPVIVPLVALGLGWLVGKLVALMFGNSDDAGNIGASVILLSLITLFGYGIYTSATAPAPGTNTPSSGTSTTPSDPLAIDHADATARLAEQQKEQLKASQERAQQNLEAMREASRKQLEALRTGTPAAIQPPTPPAPQPSTSPTAQSPTTTPTAPTLNPNIRPVIDAFEKDLDARIDALITLSSKTVPTLQRTPPHDAGRIKSRLAEAEALRSSADTVKRLLDEATNSLTSKLEGAGIPASEAHTAAFRWSGFDYKTATRGFAASSLIRIADKTREECEYLTDNLGKWTLDSRGEVKCDDFQTRAKINSLRFFVKADADRRTSIEDQLRGR